MPRMRDREVLDLEFQIHELRAALANLEHNVEEEKTKSEQHIAELDAKTEALQVELLALATRFCAPLRRRPELARCSKSWKPTRPRRKNQAHRLRMKILVAPNSLKGSLDAFAAARAIAEGLLRGLPRAETVEMPIADGGDFTAAILVASLGGAMVDAPATDPLGHVRRSTFGVLADGNTAVVEVASASGLTLVDPDHRDPMSATSYGTGELISAALDRGMRRILVGLGGTATVDAGAGLVTALGARLLDAQGASIEPGGRGLSALASIDLSGLDPRLAEAEILALCDVDCELLGERGAAPMFAPQKGATPAMVRLLAANLARFAEVVERDLGVGWGPSRAGALRGGWPLGSPRS